MYYVTFYITDKVYGGPEEGGWWFYAGEPVEDPLNKSFERMIDAHDYKNSKEVQDRLTELNEGRHDPESVLCEGWHEVFVDSEPPKAYPEERPHYE